MGADAHGTAALGPRQSHGQRLFPARQMNGMLPHPGAGQNVLAAGQAGGSTGAGVGKDLFRGAGAEHLPAVHDDHLPAQAVSFVPVVGDQKRGAVKPGQQTAHFAFHSLAQVTVQRAEGLVQHQDAGLAHQNACQRGALLLPAAAAILMGRALKAARRDGNNVLRVGVLTLAMSAAITALSFVLLEGLYLNRYWIPLMTLGAPVMAACLTGETNAPLRRGCALLFAGVVLIASAMQITSTMKRPEITDVQRERAAFLQESRLTFGYATFWNANVITELTNGEVEAVGITIAQNEKGQGVPRVSEWLEAQENRRMERPEERVFMLLTEAESERLDDFLKKSGAQARCTRDGMTAYEIESQRIFFETAQAMDTP